MSSSDLLVGIQQAHPEKEIMKVVVVAEEETRFVAIATHKAATRYRGHPPSLAFAISKDDARIEEIDHRRVCPTEGRCCTRSGGFK